MAVIILIAFFSLIGLIVIHEFGHFILAKRFGVKVEEFGIGYPPRIFGKKIGETVYSINLLPFGAFVKIYGQDDQVRDSRSFALKPIWQRALIVLGGVVSFWIVSAILLSIVMGLGVPTVIDDKANQALVDPKVQIVEIASGSPAEKSGLKIGDTIRELKFQNLKLKTDKVKEVQEFINLHRGKEITLIVQRGKEILEVSLIPRISPPPGQGAIGVGLVRTAFKNYPWHQAPVQGLIATGNLTILVIKGWGLALKNVLIGQPTGVQLMGPIGIFGLFTQVSQLGLNYFLHFIAVISIYIALFNLLPIPALDGGKLLFLGVEAIRRKPISQKIEQQITAIFFALLIALMIWVTIKDIARFFS